MPGRRSALLSGYGLRQRGTDRIDDRHHAVAFDLDFVRCPSDRISIDRNAFCKLLGNVRPIDIASPTDFIDVESRAPRRGISRR